MGTISILFFITLVALFIFCFFISQKNDAIVNLTANINELESDKFKLQREINKGKEKLCSIKNKLEQEIKEHIKEKEGLNETISKLKEDKAELSRERKNIMGRLIYSKNKLEEERGIRKENEGHLNDIIFQLDKEKKQILEDLEDTKKNQSLTIEKQIEQLAKLKKELNKIKENLQFTIKQNEENEKLINSLEEKNKDLEAINCKLKSQIKEEIKKSHIQMQNRNDNPFERMAIW